MPSRRDERPPPSAKRLGFDSRAIHAGQRPDPATGAVIPPLSLSTTFRKTDLDDEAAWGYARVANPTRAALETSLAALEGGRAGFAFASGMAAIDAVLHLLRPGDHVVASAGAYGGTRRLVDGLRGAWGLAVSWVDTSELAAVRAALRPATRMLWVETPTNPLLRLTDLRAVARLARERRLLLAVDNTFMSPFLQRPLELGAHLVVHSTTKFLNGHSDSVGGAVVAGRAADCERLGWLQKTAGAVMSPFDAFLVQRGIKTLGVRMRRHEATARELARWLADQRRVRAVHYPGLAGHPQHRLARRQMDGFGGVVTFDVGDRAAARRVLGRLRLAALAESLGGVETLAAHPASMTHGFMAPAERERLGVTDGLIRLSVGLEEPADLTADLARALR